MEVILQKNYDSCLTNHPYEPFPGFFKEYGFIEQPRGGTVLVDMHATDNSLVISRTNFTHRLGITLNPVIRLSRLFLYEIRTNDTSLTIDTITINYGQDRRWKVQIPGLDEIIERERKGEPTAALYAEQFASLNDAGIHAWQGYHLCVETSSSLHSIIISDDLDQAGQNMNDTVQAAIKVGQEIYSRLKRRKITWAELRLIADYWSMHRKLGNQLRENPDIPRDHTCSEMQNLLNPLVWKYAPKIEKRLQNAGITECDKEFIRTMESNCKDHGLPIAYSKTDGRRWSSLRSALEYSLD